MKTLICLTILTCLCFVTGQYYPAPPPSGVYAPSNNNPWFNPSPNVNNFYPPAAGWAVQQQCRQPRNDQQGVRRHDLFVGCVNQFDKLLYVDRFEKYGRWWASREKIVDYPSFGRGIRRNETITGVWAFDKGRDDSGRVSITRGGVGHKNVTVRFFSEQSGRGFHYLLQIYGH